MAGSESKSDPEPGDSYSIDVTDFIRDEVKKMIGIAVAARGNDWAIDMERDKVMSFIEQKIQLLPPSEPASGVVKKLSIICNGTKRAVHIPISHSFTEDRYAADNTSTTTKVDADGKVSGRIEDEADAKADTKDGGGANSEVGAKADTKDGGETDAEVGAKADTEDGGEANAEVGVKADTEANTDVGFKGETSAGGSIGLKGSVQHKHTHSDIKKTNKEDKQGEIDIGPTAHQKIFEESRLFEIKLTIRAHKETKVVIHRLSEIGYGGKAGAGVGLATGVGVGILGGIGGAAVGAAAGTAVPIVGNIIGGIVGGIVGAVAGVGGPTAAGAGAGAGIGALATEFGYVTLTAEEIFQTNKEIAKYRVEGDYVYLTVKHVYTAPVEKVTVNPH